MLEVDSSKEAAVCPHCGTPYIVEKAIQQFITNNTTIIHGNAVDVEYTNLRDAAFYRLSHGDYETAYSSFGTICNKYTYHDPQNFYYLAKAYTHNFSIDYIRKITYEKCNDSNIDAALCRKGYVETVKKQLSGWSDAMYDTQKYNKEISEINQFIEKIDKTLIKELENEIEIERQIISKRVDRTKTIDNTFTVLSVVFLIAGIILIVLGIKINSFGPVILGVLAMIQGGRYLSNHYL